MKNLLERLQARKQERRALHRAADHDHAVPPKKSEQETKSSPRALRWNPKKKLHQHRRRGREMAEQKQPPARIMVSAVPSMDTRPDEIPPSATLETVRDALSSSSSITQSISGGNDKDGGIYVSLDPSGELSETSTHLPTMPQPPLSRDDNDSDSDSDHHLEVDYRGHYVEKSTRALHDAIVQKALDASAWISCSRSSTALDTSSNKDEASELQSSIDNQGNTRPVSSSVLDKTGNDLFQQGKIDDAVDKYAEALTMKRQALMGQYNALRIQKGGMSDEHRARILASIATSINNLTYLRQVKGQASAEETLASYETALEIKRDILGPQHLSVGKTLNNIGSVHYMQRNYHAAAESYEHARDILQLNLGENHLDICTVTSNLGDVHFCLRQWKRAVDEYRAALQLRWKLLGPTDPKVVRLMEQIAELEMNLLNDEGGLKEVAHHESDDDSDGDTDLNDSFEALQAEIHQEIQNFDLLQRQEELDMVKDKTRVFRELRELRGEEEDIVVADVRYDDSSSACNSSDKAACPASPTPEQDDAQPYHEASVNALTSFSIVPDSLPVPKKEVFANSLAADSPTMEAVAATRMESTMRTPVASGQLSAEQRLEALSSVKNRLALLRAERQGRGGRDSPPQLSPTAVVSVTSRTQESTLSPSQILKTSELLTIQQGIQLLRSGPSATSSQNAADSTSSLIEASSLERRRKTLAEKRRITQRMAMVRPHLA